MPSAPVIITPAFTPPSPSAPAAVASAYSAGSPSAPAVVTGAFSAGTPTAPRAITSAFSAGSPSAPAPVTSSYAPPSAGTAATATLSVSFLGTTTNYVKLTAKTLGESWNGRTLTLSATADPSPSGPYAPGAVTSIVVNSSGITVNWYPAQGGLNSSVLAAALQADSTANAAVTVELLTAATIMGSSATFAGGVNSSQSVPSVVTSAFSAGSPSSPSAITSAFSAGSPSAPVVIRGAYTPPSPSAPPAITT